MVHVKNIGVRRDDWVLRNIEFTLNKGDLVGIIGESGAGKTTLLKAVAGLLDVVEGAVYLDDKKIIGPAEKLIPGYEDIQLVNQDFALESFHTVRENIREKILHLPKKDQVELVEELLDLLELTPLSERQARWLSGGEQQRLAIARALACEPRFLLLDEPFVHLDQSLRIKIMNYLLDLNAVRGTTIVLVSHDGSEMMGFVKTVIHLAGGSVQRQCSTNEMYYQPDSMKQGELMGMLNCVELDGRKLFFRPSEYDVAGTQLKLKFVRSFDTGSLVFNYFCTHSNEEVVLTSLEALKGVKSISIKKRK